MAKETGNIAAKVEQLVQPTIEELGLSLWDVRYEKEGAEWFLRVMVDRAGQDAEPMDIDTCVELNRLLNPILDKADPIDQSYYLEVGSPGLGRRLTKEHHFEKYLGEKVQISLFRKNEDGEKEVEGILRKKDKSSLTIELPSGTKEFEMKEISYVKVCDDDDLF